MAYSCSYTRFNPKKPVKKYLCILLCSVVACIICLALLRVLIQAAHQGEAWVPAPSHAFVGKPYTKVIEKFKQCGFTSIQAQPLPDLVTKCITKDGQVEPISIHGHTEGDVDAVSVGGDTAYAPGRWVPADTQVVIHYHALPEQGMAATPKK